MLKRILIIIAALLVIFVGYVAYLFLTTRNHSPQDIAAIEQGTFAAEVVYCQPFKKGRTIFGPEGEALVPFGMKWRTGANEATMLKLNEKVSFGGKELAPGRYSLYTIPNAGEWVVAINSRVDYWGAGMSDPFQEEFDVIRVKAPAQQLDSVAEQFHIRWGTPNDSTFTLKLLWDQTWVQVPVTRL
ncbi:MAG TPA: hypothetical protein DCE41_16100 [Cytophagales bacterium]|nr:hypothetical protein [Cytophagales bacterium]HAA24036.1 hypothetical protein [Cytophagales bacterium]HAP64680.1 hypothetical protein [Cytophagales bacterium]